MKAKPLLIVLCATAFFACKTTKKTAGVELTPKKNTHHVSSNRTIEELRNLSDEDKSIVFLFDNDVHCNIEGYNMMAGLRDAIRDTALCGMVTCGDFLQGGTAGAISHGQYVADVMRAMDYSVVALGNHEFDYKMPRMKELLAQLDAPIACVNLKSKETKETMYSPYVMVNIGNKKIAFIGVLTPTTLYTEEAAFYDENGKQTHELCEENLYEEVQQAVYNARKCDADYVVVLAHMGEEDNRCHMTSHDLIRNTHGIDVVLDGHSHSVVPQSMIRNKKGLPVLLGQTGTQFANVGKLLITQEGNISIDLIPTKKILYRSPRVGAVLDSINSIYKEQISRHVCKSDVDIAIQDEKGKRTVRSQECTAGNLVTDAYRHITNSDVSIANGGGIRMHLKAGNLTYGDILGLLPYENYLCVVEVPGQKIIDLLEKCVEPLPNETGDFPQVSGMKFKINLNAKPRIQELRILNRNNDRYEPIDPKRNYTIGTMDYCVTGGGLGSVLKDAKIVKQNLMLYSEALIDYIKNFLNGYVGIEYEKPEGRIEIIK